MTEQERRLLSQWVDDYTQPLMQRARYLFSDEDTAADLVQETFYVACTSLPTLPHIESPLPWLYRVLQNKAMDLYRRKYRGEGTISLDHFFDEQGGWRDASVCTSWELTEETELMKDEEFVQVFTHCLETLPEKWRMVIKLYYLSEAEASEVCQELGISTTYLWKILQRGRLQMRECLERNWFGR